ncbi:MAG: hypothetical protein COT84_08525 [Chlamydiae bacterium CG10_big_fil_rev_8_21_14_0_10_35_9]|nr:MAG: hypothetical protein COT84_08525 [Chlamydiae bacterium CG10_big_fil_rev_8_21_14_0_10_35_9]
MSGIVSSGPGGACFQPPKELPGKIFCEPQLYRNDNRAVHLPISENSSNAEASQYVLSKDREIAELMLTTELGHCWENRKHATCGIAFPPCVTLHPPVPAGLCKTACDSLAECDKNVDGKGDFGELCKDTNYVVDNTEMKDNEPVLCGSSSTVVPHKGVKILTITMLALNILANLA